MTSGLTPDQFRRLEELFHELQALDDAARRRRLDQIARDDAVIHRELVDMLDEATDVREGEAGLDELARDVAELTGSEPLGADGTELGRYRLTRRLGVGGMGEVWEAEQLEPVTRTVAVKILRQDYSSRQSTARFRAERQALASMDHPHIARVFDGGETDDGQPYFVMELVEGGVPITLYCARHELTLEQRLRLFLPVCEAVEHAHRKRIIHRDLKPTNVLVTEVGGEAVPKVIDFGIAKPMEEALAEPGSHATQIGELVGTPEYMSPEQAALGGVDVDTRSDVYTLGLLLYELLVGELPLTGRELRSLPFDELCRRIREDETPKPSTKLRLLERTAGGASQAGATTWRRIQGDLDRILGKALSKDRDQRYGSAADLAADIRRFLDDEPVLATPPSFRYRAGKFFRRHRVAVVLGALAVLGLLTALVGVSFGLVRATRAERVAETEARTASQVAAFLQNLLREGNPEQAEGAASIRDLLLLGGEKIRTELEDEPEVRARLLLTIADGFVALGDFENAIELLDESLDLRRELHGEESEEVETTLSKKVEALQRVGRLDEALATAERQRRIADAIYETDDPNRAGSMLQLGITHWRRGDYGEALPILEQALELRQAALGADHESLPSLLNNVAILYWQSGRYDDAAALYEQALMIQERELGAVHPHVASTLNNLALVHAQEQEFEEARDLHLRSLEIRREVFDEPHPDIAETLNNMAEIYKGLGNLDGAIATAEEALAMRRQLYDGPNDYVATSLFNLGSALLAQDPDRARDLLSEAREMFTATLGPEHVNTSYPVLELAQLEYRQGNLERSEELVREGLAIRENTLGPEHPLVVPPLRSLALVLEEQGRDDEAVAVRERIEGLTEESGEEAEPG